MIQIEHATDPKAWDAFLARQTYRPFLQSWTMGEVYADTGEKPIRLLAHDAQGIVGLAQCSLVPARRGRHLAIPYGPLGKPEAIAMLLAKIKEIAKEQKCSFVRISPFIPDTEASKPEGSLPAPLHLLAEHIWYLPLVEPDTWKQPQPHATPRPEAEIFSQMRSTARNLVRRAEKDGVRIEKSNNPNQDIEHFLKLHDETRKRHSFTPYTNKFFRAEVERFAARNECSLYLAHFQNEVIASSIHIHAFGETSYHHGASTERFRKIPASYLLQWTAIKDALARGDHVYNFWGIAPTDSEGKALNKKHPFAGVTLFKTGFGGSLLNLQHCRDLPVTPTYYATRAFEYIRKWRRGF